MLLVSKYTNLTYFWSAFQNTAFKAQAHASVKWRNTKPVFFSQHCINHVLPRWTCLCIRCHWNLMGTVNYLSMDTLCHWTWIQFAYRKYCTVMILVELELEIIFGHNKLTSNEYNEWKGRLAPIATSVYLSLIFSSRWIRI